MSCLEVSREWSYLNSIVSPLTTDYGTSIVASDQLRALFRILAVLEPLEYTSRQGFI